MIDTEAAWEVRETWELVGQTTRYEIRKIPLDLVWLKDEQYIMNYAIFNVVQQRLEVFTPSYAAALNSILQSEMQLEQLEQAMSGPDSPGLEPYDVAAMLRRITKGDGDAVN